MNFLLKTAVGALVLLAVVWLMLYDSIPVRLEYDEAYNLQIAESLRRGDGYSTFGALKSGEPWKFDPHITTGPVVMLPVAAVWFLTDGNLAAVRALLLVVLLVYAAAWWSLLREYRSGWLVQGIVLATALSAATAGGGRILGELTGGALLVWAGVAIAKRKPFLSAFAVGLAVQAKIVYGVAGTLMLATWLLAAIASRETPRPRSLISMAAIAAAPSLLFELYRLVSFGSVDMYLQSIREFQQFLAGQRVPEWLDPSLLGAKVAGILGSYPGHAWVALGAGALALICRSALLDAGSRAVGVQTTPLPAPMLTALAALLVAGSAMLAGWIAQSMQPGVRQALPFFLLSMPALVALCLLLSVRFLRDSREHRQSSPLLRGGVIAAAGLLSISMALSLVARLEGVAGDEVAKASAREQKEVTELIQELRPASLYAKGFWHNPEYQILTGIRGVARRTYDRQLLVVQDYQVALSNTTWADHESKCGEVIRKNAFTLLCWMPEAPTKELFRVIDWGPKSTVAGTVPLPQPGGGSALWFKIGPVIPEDVGPLRLHVGRYVTEAVLSSTADLVSGTVPDALFAERGSHEVVLEQVTTERRLLVGTLRVE